MYLDIVFPNRIALGASREPEWSTTVVQNFGGFTSANLNWSNAKHAYDIALAIRTADDYKLVLAHFHSVRGRWKAFPFQDPLDYRCEQSEGSLIDNGESPAGDYQLAKTYGTGADSWVRRITRPKPGVIVYRTRAGVVTTATATVSLTTGRVTVAGHVAGDTYAWSGQFWTPCRYDSDKLPAVVVDRKPGGGEYLVRCESIRLVETREDNGDA